MQPVTADEISERVAAASGGALSIDEAKDEQFNLLEKGFTSLSFLRLVDDLEVSYGVYIDLEGDTTFLGRVSSIVKFLNDERSG